MRKGDRILWKYLIAIVLFAHGIGQIMPLLASWTNVKVFSDASWIFSSGVGMRSPVGHAFALLGLLALLGFVGGTLGLLFGQGWWQPMLISASLISASLISLLVAIPWAAA